jgi:hypothetical protein
MDNYNVNIRVNGLPRRSRCYEVKVKNGDRYAFDLRNNTCEDCRMYIFANNNFIGSFTVVRNWFLVVSVKANGNEFVFKGDKEIFIKIDVVVNDKTVQTMYRRLRGE